MVRTRLGALLAAGALAAAGCSGPSASVAEAEKAVATFHERLSAGRCEEIHQAADEGFRASGPKQQFLDVCAAVARKLGAIRSADRQSWRVFVGTGGTSVQFTYKTAFEQGSGAESFNVKVSGGSARVLAWNIQSNELITR